MRGERVFESDRSCDLACKDLFDLFALVSLKADDAAEALFLACCSIVNISSCFDRSGVDAEEGQLTDERVVLQLESES